MYRSYYIYIYTHIHMLYIYIYVLLVKLNYITLHYIISYDIAVH